MPLEAHQGSTSEEFRAHSNARWAWFGGNVIAIMVLVVGFWLAIARPHWMTFLIAAFSVLGIAFTTYSTLSLANRVTVHRDGLSAETFGWRTTEMDWRDVTEIQLHDPGTFVPTRFVRTAATDGRAIVFSSGSMRRADELLGEIAQHAPHAQRGHIPRTIRILLGG